MLNQHTVAQNIHFTQGHATRAGPTEQQPAHYEFSTFPQPPKFENKLEEREYLKGRLAAAFRIFGKQGFDEGVAGHITLRDPIEPTTMWVNPFGVSFNKIRRSDLVRIDHTGNVLEGGQVKLVNRAAIMIHVAIHEARPDVICAAHTHSLYGRSYASLGVPLPITTQDACAFYNDLAFYNDFEGIVLEESEGLHLAQALGDKKAMILQNHGLLAAAGTVEATVFWYISLDRLCHTQLLALAAVGGDASRIVKVSEKAAANSYLSLGQPMSGWFSAKPLFDKIAEDTNEAYLA